MTMQAIGRFLTGLGVWTASPWAFGVFGLYAVAWLVLERHSLDLHGIATLATWLMTLCIQRAEHRDTQAIHAKLDELLRAHHSARESLSRIDEAEPEEIERHRTAQKAEARGHEGRPERPSENGAAERN